MTVLRLTSSGLQSAPAWPRVEDDAPLPDSGPALVSFARWQVERGSGRTLGVWLDLDVQDLPASAQLPAVVALAFPVFTDGRAYSLARRLRRAGYLGELRATGDVLIDQLRAMARVGFTAFEVSNTVDLAEAERVLALFPGAYQPAADGQASFAWRRHAGRAAE